jgi:hypothetical protein
LQFWKNQASFSVCHNCRWSFRPYANGPISVTQPCCRLWFLKESEMQDIFQFSGALWRN